MTIRVSEAVLGEMRREGERAYPAECCGVLAGRSATIKEVLRLRPMPNRRPDNPHRYLIASDDLRAVTAELAASDLDILGFYHSHPDHPAAPSGFDLEHAWPWYSYIIVRVDGGRSSQLTSWVLEDDRSAMRAETVDVFTEV
jgi:proteasome lid subunit RPN8/RPN11